LSGEGAGRERARSGRRARLDVGGAVAAGRRRVARSLALLAALLGGCASAPLPYLWRAGPAERPVHLLGTVHQGVPPEDLPPAAWEALAASERLVLEVDLEAVPEAPASLPDDRLDELLGPEDWAALRELLPGVDPEELARLEPIAVRNRLYELLVGVEPLEPALLARARALGLEVGWLEEVEEQVALLRGDREAALAGLRRVVRDPDALARSSERLRRAYVERRVEELLAGGARTLAALDVAARTRRWLPAVEDALLEGERTLFAVGVAHLLGPDGLVGLLRQRGWTVTRVGE